MHSFKFNLHNINKFLHIYYYLPSDAFPFPRYEILVTWNYPSRGIDFPSRGIFRPARRESRPSGKMSHSHGTVNFPVIGTVSINFVILRLFHVSINLGKRDFSRGGGGGGGGVISWGGGHEPRPIAQKIRKHKNMLVKNQWENAKLIMLNNKASIDNGSWFFYSISKIKQKLFLLISCYMCWRLL